MADFFQPSSSTVAAFFHPWWLLDPEEESILAVFPAQRLELFEGTAHLAILKGVELELTVEQVFGWLTFG